MRISIFGLGYVGAVCAGCLSARGHEVVGVDVSTTKIDLINNGSPHRRTRARRAPAARPQDRPPARHHRCRRRGPRHRSLLHLRRHPEQEERRPGTGLHRRRLPRDRFRPARQVRAPHRRRPQHRAAGHRDERGHPDHRGLLRQEGRRRLRRRGEPRVPARKHRDQDYDFPPMTVIGELDRPPATCWKPCTANSTHRSSARKSRSPR